MIKLRQRSGWRSPRGVLVPRLAAGAALVVVAACSSSASGGSSSGGPGNSGSPIKIGLITSLSGALAPQFAGVNSDFKARIDVANASGGVDGRKIEVFVADDAGSLQGNLTAAQSLVQSDHVLAVADESAFVAGAIRFLHQHQIPVVGGDYSGPFWGQQPYTNMFGDWGSVNPSSPVYTTIGAYLKSAGAAKLGSVGFGDSPSSKEDATNQAMSAKAAGVPVAYLNTTVQIGSNDFSSEALGLKQASVDTLYSSMGGPQSISLLTAAKQAGARIVHAFFISGYSPSIIGSSAQQALQGVDFGSYYAPQQADTSATQAVVAALKKYAGLSSSSFYGFDIMGWLSASLVVRGLQAAGADPTSASFISGLRKVSGYDAEGLLPAPVNFADFGSGTTEGLSSGGCLYVVRLVGSAFEVQNNSKPICGTPARG
jgi:branched-chain amino acid transport system substrate-binding protein